MPKLKSRVPTWRPVKLSAGPWVTEPVAGFGYRHVIVYFPDGGMTPESDLEANARVISAIPDIVAGAELVDMLTNTDGSPCDGFRFREGLAMLRKALDKARGRRPRLPNRGTT